MDETADKVTIRLTQQQIEVLERLRQQGGMGDDYPEIMLNAFRRYTEHALGKGRFGNVGRA
jgi:hypothetical protein